MPRRVVVKRPKDQPPVPATAEPPPQPSTPDAGGASPPAEQSQSARTLDLDDADTAQQSVDRVVRAVFRLDPDQVARELEAAERLPRMSLSVALDALDRAASLAIKASRVASILSAQAARYKDFDLAAHEAEIRDRARESAPRRQNKDGTEKALTVQELKDYMLAHYAEDLQRVKMRAVELAEAAAHWGRVAEVWRYRPRALEVIVESLRLSGDLRSDG